MKCLRIVKYVLRALWFVNETLKKTTNVKLKPALKAVQYFCLSHFVHGIFNYLAKKQAI